MFIGSLGLIQILEAHIYPNGIRPKYSNITWFNFNLFYLILNPSLKVLSNFLTILIRVKFNVSDVKNIRIFCDSVLIHLNFDIFGKFRIAVQLFSYEC